MSQLSRAEKLTLCSDNSFRLYVCLQSWAKIESQKIRIIISLTFFCWTSLSFHRPFLVPHVMHIYNSWGSVGARSMISCPCAIIKEFIINFTYIFSTESPSSLSSILLINHSINSRYSSLHWRVSHPNPKLSSMKFYWRSWMENWDFDLHLSQHMFVVCSSKYVSASFPDIYITT